MTGKLTARGVETRSRIKGRYLDGDGLFLRVLDPGKRVYWTYRFRLNGVDREMSVGRHPDMSLAEARDRHIDLRKLVKDGVDPVGDRRKAKAVAKAGRAPSNAPIFGAMADAYLERQEKRGQLGKNRKHRAQWRSTLAKLPAWFRDLSVDEIGPQQVFDALDPIWTRTPETGSRLRGRIATVMDFARGPDDARPNPAAWSDWLKKQLGSPRKLGKIDRKTGERVQRAHHRAMPYASLPTLMAKLAEIDTVASRALQFTILTCARSGEALGAQWDEISFDDALWRVPASRMKMQKPHDAPLSDAAVAILRAQEVGRGQNPHIFPGRPMRSLSDMSMAMLMRRLGAGDYTVHGMRSAFRDWAADTGIAFEAAEQCLAHATGNAVTRAYLRTSMLERRRPVLSMWANYVTGSNANNVIELRRAGT